MSNPSTEVALDLFPYLKVYKDGTVERIVGVEVVPPGLDPETNVLSKDITIIPETGVSARIYRPNNLATKHKKKLPLVLYFHGGAFVIASTASPYYHTCLNKVVAEANIIALSVDYRLAPEHPLPTAYEDSYAALQWVASHIDCEDEAWIKDYADLHQVFLAGDSAGANIAHHLALRTKESGSGQNYLKIVGIGMIHPYFWGTKPIGSEVNDGFTYRKEVVDKWWLFVCPSDKGCDDPLINPFVVDGSPDHLAGLACDAILVIVAEKDILKDRGRLYYDELVKSGWKGKAEIMETEGEDHAFHILNPHSDKANCLIKRLASFFNQRKAPVE